MAEPTPEVWKPNRRDRGRHGWFVVFKCTSAYLMDTLEDANPENVRLWAGVVAERLHRKGRSRHLARALAGPAEEPRRKALSELMSAIQSGVGTLLTNRQASEERRLELLDRTIREILPHVGELERQERREKHERWKRLHEFERQKRRDERKRLQTLESRERQERRERRERQKRLEKQEARKNRDTPPSTARPREETDATEELHSIVPFSLPVDFLLNMLAGRKKRR